MAGDTGFFDAHLNQNTQPPVVDQVRPITLIHADIVGSTRIIRDLDEEGARLFLDEAIAVVRTAIKTFGGHVVRIQGDGVLAIFGATVIQEDHAWRAVLAADQIRKTFRAKAHTDPMAPAIRLGVHSGPIYLRWQSHDFGLVLDAVGTTAHITARVESACRPNEIALSDRVVALLPERLGVEWIGQISSEDSAASIEVYELCDLALSDPLLTLPKSRAFHLVGRDKERQAIREFIENPWTGGQPALAVIGPPGMGKSRLLDDASDLARKHGLDFLVFRGRELQSKQPFGALKLLYAQIIQRLTTILDARDRELLTRCGVLPQAAQHMVAALEGNRYSPRSDQPVLPDRLHKYVLEGLRMLLARLTAESPILLLCDDVQYLDGASLSFLTDLVRNGAGLNIRVLMFSREELDAYVNSLGLPWFKLGPLTDAEARELVKTILNLEPETEGTPALEQILSRSQGLPLALTEFAEYTSRLRQIPGKKLALPLKIDTIFRARLDALGSDERHLCNLACILGNEMPISHLEMMGDLLTPGINSLIQSLLDRNVMVDRFDGRVQFSHQLFHEAAYAALSQSTRTKLHTQVYSRLNSSRLPTVAHIDLARHAHLSGYLPAAVTHYWRACQEAVALAEVSSVVAIYEKAQSLCREIGDEAQTSASRFAMLAFDAAQQLAEQEKCHEDLQAITNRKINVDDGTLMVAHAHQAMVNWIGGRGREGLENARRAHAAITQDTPLSSRWYVEFALGILEFSNSRPQAALKRLEGVVRELSDGNLDKKFGSVVSIPGFLARAFGGWIASDLGEFDIAQSLCVEAIEIADRLNHNNSRLIGRIAEGHYNLRYFDAERAVEILSDAHTICYKFGFYGYEPSTSSRLAMALLHCGDTQRARKVVEDSLAANHHLKIINSSSHLLYDAQARVLDALGQSDVALEQINRAIARCEILGDGVQAAFAQLFSIELRLKLYGPQETTLLELDDLAARSRAMGLKRLLAQIEGIRRSLGAKREAIDQLEQQGPSGAQR
jgi:class 3 adenylate cyclase/tetratricopeptide (TPR) repeat protein